jgi:hypothetical protein
MVTSHSRGHEIYHDGKFWRYQDTKEKVNDERPCKQCGLPPTPEGRDACLCYIKDATAACCDHGIVDGEMATAHSRGHEIFYDGEFWRYQDSGETINNERPCKQCGLPPTEEGDDACLGHIKGATAACCGHGIADGYIRWFQKREAVE